VTKVEYLEDLASRRKFIHALLSTGFGAMVLSFAYPVLRFLVPPKVGEPRVASVEVPWKAAELKPNSGRIFKFGSQPGILIKTPQGEIPHMLKSDAEAGSWHPGCVLRSSIRPNG